MESFWFLETLQSPLSTVQKEIFQNDVLQRINILPAIEDENSSRDDIKNNLHRIIDIVIIIIVIINCATVVLLRQFTLAVQRDATPKIISQ